MRSTRILLGVGLLNAGLMTGFASQASAQVRQDRQDVKQAAKDVRQQRRDVKHADTPAEKQEQRQQLRDAKGNLRNQKQELRHDLNHRNTVQPAYRYNGNTHYNNNAYYNNNARYNNSARYNHNRYNNAQSLRTLEGVVTNDVRGQGFVLRSSSGGQTRVQVQGGQPNRLSHGDVVRVYGYSTNGTFYAQNLAILRNR